MGADVGQKIAVFLLEVVVVEWREEESSETTRERCGHIEIAVENPNPPWFLSQNLSKEGLRDRTIKD